MGYIIRNSGADSLAERCIGFVIPEAERRITPLRNAFVCGAADAALQRGYRLTMVPCRPETIREDLKRGGCRSLLMIGEDQAMVENFFLRGLHLEYNYVFLNRCMDFQKCCVVEEIHEERMLKLYQDLRSAGYDRLALLGTSASYFSYSRQFAAFQKFWGPANAKLQKYMRRIPEDAPQECYDYAVESLIRQPEPPQLLIVFRTRFLEGTLKALEKLHVRIPKDLEMIVIDNDLGPHCRFRDREFANFSYPSKREFAAAAIRFLLQRLKTPGAEPERIGLPMTYNPGASCKYEL